MKRLAANCTLLCFLTLATTVSSYASGVATLSPVSIKTGAHAAQPSLARDGSGSFILTWQEQEEQGSSLKFARIDSEGREIARGTIARSAPGTSWFVNWADFPSLTVLDNGDWVSFWLQRSGEAAYAYDILLTRSTDQGQNWSPPVRLHRDDTKTEHGFVSLAPAGDDRVLAVWLDGRNTAAQSPEAGSDHTGHGGGMSLRSAMVDRAGHFSEEWEIDPLTCDCCNTDTLRVGGQFMTLYRNRTESEVRDHSFSLLQPGNGWSEPRTVYTDNWKTAACPVNGPALTINGNHLLAVWTTMENEELSVRAAMGNAHGFGEMMEIEASGGVQGRVDAVAFGPQGFLVSWLGRSDQDPGLHAIRIVTIDPETGLGAKQSIAELTGGRSSGFPRMASSGDTALITWTEPSAEGSSIRLARITP